MDRKATVYYNEIDKNAANWLRELISAKLIPNGFVDERDIRDVKPKELEGFTQCHFFAGIGGWPYALGLAGFRRNRSVWTGSCPCQPFSIAGNGKGTSDENHLWPAFRWLIAQCKPTEIFGEQVASKDGLKWLSGIRADLEILGYRFGGADLPAASVKALHKRSRLFWVANSVCKGRKGHKLNNSIPCLQEEAHTVNSNDFTFGRMELSAGPKNLLPCNGLSVGMARSCVKGYGNAIVPQVAVEFIKCYMATGFFI